MSSWIYNNKKFTNPGNFYGFIYKITDDTGKFYIGKKAFTHNIKRKLSKKARKSTGKRVSYELKDSGWKDYWGSCKPLLEYIAQKGNTKGFKREIIKLCNDKISLTYWEIYYLMTENVIFNEKYWNNNVAGKFHRGRIHQ